MNIISDIIITTTVVMTTEEFESLDPDDDMAFHDLQVREKVRLILPEFEEFDGGSHCKPRRPHCSMGGDWAAVSFHSNSRKDADQIVAELKAIILRNVARRGGD